MVDILMATYNGERYIEQQIESILNQDFSEWVLYIRDDGSKDKTLSIVNSYVNKYPKKIILINDGKRNLGPKLNFAELIKYSKNNYCMFCDQDDVWLENKISITLDKMLKLEKQYGAKKPILVHTDLVVVDSDLNIINNSFWQFSSINPKRNSVNELLVENTVTGCTMMINKSMKKISKELPEECVMHDWWFALIASSLGVICSIDEKTILYRQHESNQIGARKKTTFEKIKSTKIELNTEQALAFNNMYKNNLLEKERNIISDFSILNQCGFFKKRYLLLKNKFFSNRTLRSLKIIIFI